MLRQRWTGRLAAAAMLAVSGAVGSACIDMDGLEIDFGRDCASDVDCSGYVPAFELFYG